MFCSSQFGFRENLSTCDAVLNLVSYIYDAFDEGKMVIGASLDLARAFDSINRDILIRKLESYGVQGVALTWVRSYLNSRKQFVNFNGTHSSMKGVDYGVIQGSISGPVMFIIFINDIVRCTDLVELVMYADDTTVYLKSDNVSECAANVNEGLRHINQ